jgi:hypothetical protein
MRDRPATIGPCAIALVPVSKFSKLKGAQLCDAWEIVGPSAQKNLESSPLWAVIAAAYLEGLNHGASHEQ